MSTFPTQATITMPNGSTYVIDLATDGINFFLQTASRQLPPNLKIEDTSLRQVHMATAISNVDGKKGELDYRGYPIEDLVTKTSYEEVAYLLLRGDLPNASELSGIKQKLAGYAVLSQDAQAQLVGALAAMKVDEKTNATSLFSMAISVMNSIENLRVEKPSQRYETALRSVAVMPTLIGLVNAKLEGTLDTFRFAQASDFGENGKDFSLAKLTLGSLQNKEPSQLDGKQVDAMDKYLILHAEHGLNLSTSTARLVDSGEAIDGGWRITLGANQSLAGNRHGNAANDALENLKRIQSKYQGSVAEKVAAYIEDVNRAYRATKGILKPGEPEPLIEISEKVPGMGHKVYKKKDPRSTELQKILKDCCAGNELLEIALELESQLKTHPNFGAKATPIFPNVDFCSGLMLSEYLHIDPRLMTSMFAVGRNVGWHAHAAEHARDAKNIVRPEAIPLTPRRAFIEVADRTPATQGQGQQAELKFPPANTLNPARIA